MALKNRLQNLTLYIGLLYLVVSCNTKYPPLAGLKVFRYNEHSNISSLDPAFAKTLANIWGVNQLFNGLVQLDDSLHVAPDIAKSWVLSPDGKTYTFTLRKDVFFHQHELFGKDSTRHVVAQDFTYSFNRLKDPKVASPGGWILQTVKSYKAVNDSVFQINLTQAFPPFLGLLAMKYCSVVPKEAVDYFGDEFRSNPIGTGPFKFKLWVENTKLVYLRNTNYYESDSAGKHLPYLDAVAITFLPDKQNEFLQLIQGNLDFITGLDPSYKDDIIDFNGQLNPQYTNQLYMLTGAYLNTEYLGFLIDSKKNNAIQNIWLRKAINYGFNRRKMIRFLRNGIGTPAVNGFIPKGLPAFNNLKGYNYNPEKAREYLKKYTLETGDTNPRISINTDANYLDLCEYIQRELQKIGLEVAVNVNPPATLRQAKANGKFSVFRASWIADYPDSENYLSLFYSKNLAPNGPNYTHFNNAAFDALYERSFSAVTLNERYNLYQKMDSLIISNAPIVPLYYDQVVRFVQKNITGLNVNPINALQLKWVKKN
ncbi:MAG: ABC transporter substrate-binding protein [Flavobacteriaceae bacterium]|nr:ABC transporter substrate-binding protein [Flavobacteriaceae bacterium]